MTRPTVGICAAIEQARWGPWDQDAMLTPRTYVDVVAEAGGLPILLPPEQTTTGSPGELVDRIDALLLTGGADLDPASYGGDAHPEIVRTRPERDRFEMALARESVERDVPVLGICRGMQLLNVARGGTLVQHLPDELGDERHEPTPGRFAEHSVRLESGSLAAGAAGAELLTVKTHHHQGVAELGDGLVATGWAQEDDLIEAIEMPDKDFALGVLWHPEEDPGNGVIPALVDSAERAGRG
jgi:putative glutamine amidotransferase